MWSPLVSGSTLAPGVSHQDWDPPKATSQFVLTPKIRPKTIAPSFAALAITKRETQGNTVVTGEPGKVASVTLNDEGAKRRFSRVTFGGLPFRTGSRSTTASQGAAPTGLSSRFC